MKEYGKRQSQRRIDSHEKIVVERCRTFHHYQCQGGYTMTSTELKHQARLQEWAAAIQDCRSSGLTVRQWCKQRGITPTTYYRWERELLSIGNAAPALPTVSTTTFVELPALGRQSRNVADCSATLRMGDGCIELYQELNSDLLKAMVEALRSC